MLWAGHALFVHHDPVVVLSTSVTAAAGVLPVLANTTLAVRDRAAHGPCLLPDLLDHGLSSAGARRGRQGMEESERHHSGAPQPSTRRRAARPRQAPPWVQAQRGCGHHRKKPWATRLRARDKVESML
jgi:hypothetical protein